MGRYLTVALVQSDLIWENPEQNRQKLTEKINSVPYDTDLIILPEMFTSGFTMSPETVAETMSGVSIDWLKNIALKRKIAVTGSLIVQEDGKFYNRLVFVHPDGHLDTYDKRHLFTLAGEEKRFTQGLKRLIVDYKGWKICPMICYDLRFPVWSRNTEDYDFLIYVANWPKPRIDAWNTLLKARAIENMAYCAGVNRIGTDPNKFTFTGHSAIYNVLGEKISNTKPDHEVIETITLDRQELLDTRKKLKFLRDRDEFFIKH